MITFCYRGGKFILFLLTCGLTPTNKIKLVQKFSVIGFPNSLMWSVTFSTCMFYVINCITPCYAHKLVLFLKAKEVMLFTCTYLLAFCPLFLILFHVSACYLLMISL